MQQIQATLAAEITEATGWDLIGASIHYDSSRPHINLYISRVTQQNTLVGIQRLRTVGPWSVGQWRLAKIGAGGDTGNAKLLANLKKFQSRHGADAEPLDLRLHRILDEQFEATLSDAEIAKLNICKEYHRVWKANQRELVAEKEGRGEALALALLRVVKPLLPTPIRLALNGINQVAGIIRVLREFAPPPDSIPQMTQSHHLSR